jgi:hypothetical protein
MVAGFDLAGRDPVATIALIAFFYWLLLRIYGVLGGLLLAKFQRPFTPSDQLVQTIESAQARLRTVFADDIEKIALYGGAYEGTGRKHTAGLSTAFLGCGLMILWAGLSMPVIVLLGLSVIDGISRLFGPADPSVIYLSGADSPRLLPLMRDFLMFGRTFRLADRSFILTLAMGTVGCLIALLNVSRSGWRIPELRRVPILAFGATLILCYFVLDTGLLLFGAFALSYSLALMLAQTFFIRPLWIEISGRFRWGPALALRRQTARED